MDIDEIIEKFDQWPGMMSVGAGFSFLSILGFQDTLGTDGDFLEFGVYKGKSAFLASHFLRAGQTLDLVDVYHAEELEGIRPEQATVKFHHQSSEDFCDLHTRRKSGNYRFLHADGSHTFNNVWSDLKGFEQMGNSDSIVCLDDFYNMHYNQVQAAAYTYLAKERSDFRFFLGGENKAFLCRKGQFKKWKEFALKEFPRRMAELGYPVRLSKTDAHEDHDFVYFEKRGENDAEIWGEELYSVLFSEGKIEAIPSYKTFCKRWARRIGRKAKRLMAGS